MVKKKFYTISTKGKYGSDRVLHRCTNLDAAMELFKYLVQANIVEVSEASVFDNTKEPDEDGYVPSMYLRYEKGEEYHLGTEIIDIYSEEEIEKIQKEREEWKATLVEKSVEVKKDK